MDLIYPITISLQSEEPLANQVHRQLTWLIGNHQYGSGDKLPSIRQLARQLGINMLTVRSAYLRLEKEGLVQTRQGAGTYVLPFNPRALVEMAGRTRSYTIGVILPGMSDPFYHDFLQGVEQGIGQEQLLMFVCNAHENLLGFQRYFSQLFARNVDGVIAASYNLQPYIGDVQTNDLPFVTVDSPDCTGPVINFDLEEAGFQATWHLVEHGYKSIGLITFSEEVGNVTSMYDGYTRALREAGIDPADQVIIRVPGFTMDHGVQAARQLLQHVDPPRAVFTVSDTLALGIMRQFKSVGKHVPADLAVTSLDDISFASLVEPGLTTVSLPAKQLGVEAMKMLRRIIDREKLAEYSMLLPVKLMVRGSCGCSELLTRNDL